MGYSKENLRQEKYKLYMDIDAEGKNGSLSQYKSIIDTNPNLLDFHSNYNYIRGKMI
jgi:hypothetical protein